MHSIEHAIALANDVSRSEAHLARNYIVFFVERRKKLKIKNFNLKGVAATAREAASSKSSFLKLIQTRMIGQRYQNKNKNI